MSIDEQLFKSILDDCGFEVIPLKKIARLQATVELSDVDRLMTELIQLDLSMLEDDAGDIGDEYWRITCAIARILSSLGAGVLKKIDPFRGSNLEYVQMAIKMTESAVIDQSFWSDA
ncbi:MAG: hypothetical protein AAGB29_08385 [Planctomycetota bacterium]